MALSMKQWLAVIAVGCALVAVWALPPQASRGGQRVDHRLWEEVRRDALIRRAQSANYQIQRIQWADSLIPATLAGTGPVTFGFPDSSDPDAVASARARAVDRALDDVRNTPSDMAVGLFFLSQGTSAYSEAPRASTFGTVYYFGARDGRPYCVAVHPQSDLTRSNSWGFFMAAQGDSHLGLCALLRSYGLPGPAVHHWLAEGGTALAASTRPADAPLLAWATEAQQRRGPFGQRQRLDFSSAGANPFTRCESGITAGCADLFLHPGSAYSWFDDAGGLPRPSEVSAIQTYSLDGPMDPRTVARLAQEFGPERFQRWWTAEGNLADAFQTSFGIDVGTWTLTQVRKHMEITKPGPGVAWSGLLGGLVIMTLSSVIAGMWAIRRRVA